MNIYCTYIRTYGGQATERREYGSTKSYEVVGFNLLQDKLKKKSNRASCILQLCARPSTYLSGRKSGERTRPLAIVIHFTQENIQWF